MGWQEFYRRRDALDTVVSQGELRVGDAFPDEESLLLALHHRWAQRLAARVDLAQLEADDLVDAVGSAWRQTAEDNAELRALLDSHADHPVLRPLVEAEQRMLARAAGLTEAGDSTSEETRIGAAFLALQKTAADGGRRNPVERLFRRLASA